jgi:hypothetical protein
MKGAFLLRGGYCTRRLAAAQDLTNKKWANCTFDNKVCLTRPQPSHRNLFRRAFFWNLPCGCLEAWLETSGVIDAEIQFCLLYACNAALLSKYDRVD